MSRQIEDPEFGTLEMDTLWVGRASIPPIGDAVDIEIATQERRPPEDWQREAFRHFKAALGPKLMEKMREVIQRYLLREGHHLEDPFSVLEEPLIFIPAELDGRIDLVVQWSSELDEEHGLQVMFREGVPVRASQILDDALDDDE